MARGDQLGRQWRIIRTLISSRMGMSAADLASEIDCHPRTIYRDLEALQVAGFPIYNERAEGRNLWSVLDTVKRHIPIPFSLTELMALYFGRDLLKVFRGTVFYDSLETLFRKVRTVLPPESKKFLKGVEKTLHLGLKPYKEYGRFREIINRVNDAALNRKSIEIVYYTMSRKKETRRRVDPYRILFFNATFYLIGHCHMRNEVRIFALDRIRILYETGTSFQVPEDFDFEEFMRPSFGIYQGKPVRVRIRFDSEVAGYVMEKIWHESQKIFPQEDGAVIYEAEVSGTEEIRFWVMSWGSKAQVLEPRSLRDEIRKEAGNLLKRYENGAERKWSESKSG